MGNMVRLRLTIRGTRALLQNSFGPDAIPLEKGEKTGVAGNDPEEWKRSCMVTGKGELYMKPENVFGCIRDGSKHTKKGRGSIQALVSATLQIEEGIILLNRSMPEGGIPPADPTAEVFLHICGVRNPATKGRNIRYRLAASAGWECTFTLTWDKTIVSREQMRAAITDAGILVGLCDGRTAGYGRFKVIKTEELEANAEETAAA